MAGMNEPQVMPTYAAANPTGCETRRISSRIGLVSSLLREAEQATTQGRKHTSDFQSKTEEWAFTDSIGAAWNLNGGNDPQTRRFDPARAVASWYLRGRTGLEELLLQLYFGRLSTAEVESLVVKLWGRAEGASLVREVVPGIIERINCWLSGPTQPFYPYVFLHSVEYRCRRNSETYRMRVAAAVGINELGYREALGIVAGPIGSVGLWDSLLEALGARGVRSAGLVVGGTTDGAMRAAVESRWEGCGFLMPHSELERGLLGCVDPSDYHWVHKGVSELIACASRSESIRIGMKLRVELKKAGYAALSGELNERLHRHLACFDVPKSHLPRLRSANIVRTELNRLREQARALGPIHDEKTIVLLAAAIFRRQGRSSWSSEPFLSFF